MNKDFLVVVLFFLVILIFTIIYFNKKLDVTRYNIENKKIPQGFNGFKIAQVSDFHSRNGKLGLWLDPFYKKLENEKPNIIVVTGDLINLDKEDDIKYAMNFLDKASKIAPTYYIYGNHEASFKRKTLLDLEEHYKDNPNIIFLNNKKVDLIKNDEKITLVGVDDLYSFGKKKSAYVGKIKELSGCENYTILLSHRPEYFDTYVENDYDLVFCGHTHGGQARIPFIGGVIAPDQGYFPKYDFGLFKEKNTTMIISRGLGNTVAMLAQLRINNSPELVIVELKSIKKEA